MKKYVVFSFLMIVGLVSSSVYALHPGSTTSKEQPVAPQASAPVATSQAAVPEVKSPWSGSVKIEMERSTDKKPLAALKNRTSVTLGRTLFDDVSVNLAILLDNKFTADTAKQGVNRYFTTKDPLLYVSKGKVAEVLGINISAAPFQVWLPITENSRRNGDERNPHNGIYRSAILLTKDIGAWSLASLNRVSYFNYRRQFSADGSENARFGMLNELAASYKLSEVVALSSVVDFVSVESRDLGKTALDSTLEWSPSLDLTPAQNLEVSLGVTLTAPNKTPRRYWESAESRIANTSSGLVVSYKFL
ncbi:MAG: hypothetical protein A2Z91_00300 [Deltaproteobacteria bacterium GWA2_38_16]|nr:MAG: hypothetical protein A2Z91_00300 [Deltaproteobacteria bacterium GWA2_38_16]OGQ03544.1 MAG: hypothetical protein A3D19_01705 [Deltaproteobacteria bacterium RIFCSPHIGHO2_02_FULL_38_15]OGQ59483.1 MAG: hypothetical protein A3G92_02595 [Deltaproteobacteria bacterium RIFCSPLOWO2_12_FULL_38_8]HBQ21215.1 hypothetical protein [Deltaproteobacteria bacterium]